MSDGRISYDITAGAPGFAAAFAGVKSTVGQTVGQLRGLSGPLSQLGGALGGLGPVGGVIGQTMGPLRGVGEEDVRRRALPLRVRGREMRADVAVGQRAVDRVGERVQGDVGVR